MSEPLQYLTLEEASRQLRAGEVSSEQLAVACLEQAARLDPVLNTTITPLAETALAEARELDRELAAGRWRGPLHGVPVGVKDLIDVAGLPTTCGSNLLRDRVAETDAYVVQRLRAAGAVLITKQNLHEFAYGVTSDTPATGSVRNPWDIGRSPGGSSGGSAAAVAAGLCYASIGTDTGGSIRIPASLCGVVGLKPTYGRVSRRGVYPLAWSLDHIGPLARTARDASLVLEAIAGHDRGDVTSARRRVPAYLRALSGDVRGVKIGLPREWFWDTGDPEVIRLVREAIGALAEAGAVRETVSVPALELARSAQALILSSEATSVHRQHLRTAAPSISPGVRMRLAQGLFVTASEYVLAQRARTYLRQQLLETLQSVDVLVTPACPITAPLVGEVELTVGGRREPTVSWLTRCSMPFNLAGLPAVSVPCGFTQAGLPVGLQIVGRPFDESTVLRVADAYERAHPWVESRPLANA